MRLDQYITSHGYVASRAQAQDAIKEGRVQVDGAIIQKNSFLIKDAMQVELIQPDIAFASRAGYKLYDALDTFGINLENRCCIDVGASTGGFSDVCLKKQARFVYAVDVGKDQLIDRLRHHPQVGVMEQCNCRYLEAAMFSQPIDFACMDVSFISITKILPALFATMAQVEAVVLIKPQFEAGKASLNKQGIVKDEKIHIQVLQHMVRFVEECGYYVQHLCASSILGRDGNKEFIMHIVETPVYQVFPYKEIVHNYTIKR